MTLDFQKPARIDDVLEVHTSLSEYRGARIKLDQLVYRGKNFLYPQP